MTKEEETAQIDKEIKEVLAKHPGFALSAVPFIEESTGTTRARPVLVFINPEGVLEA